MSLPAEYSALLNDLNRDVLRSQPSDPLQFCATWFFNRLEHERVSSRRSQSHPISLDDGADSPPQTSHHHHHHHQRAATPPAPPLSNTPAVTPPRPALKLSDQPGLPDAPAEGYRFGGPVSRVAQPQNTDLPSPYSKSNNPPLYPVPAGSNARAGRVSPGPSQRAMEALAKRASVSVPRPRTESDDERSMMDDRTPAIGVDSDDEDTQAPPPPPAKVSRPSSGQSNGHRAGRRGGDDDEAEPMPPGINLGRRTSVSAESLTPSMLNGPQAPKVVIPKTASQRARIEASIASNLLFRDLDEAQHEDVLNAMKEVRVGQGTEVIVQGAVGDYFYVVEEGTFDVYVRGPPTYTYVPSTEDASATGGHRRTTPPPSRTGGQTITTQAPAKKVHSYGPGGAFGELALMYNAPRAATVVATSPSATLWALDRVTFRSILMEHTSRKRGMYETFLSSVPILTSLTSQERSKVADALEQRSYNEGEHVVNEGEPGKEFYIVESGRAEVLKRRGSGEDIVGTLKAGDYFGELALINSAPRAATVRVAPGHGRLRVACLGEKAFTRLLGPVIEILARKAEDYDRGDARGGAPNGGGGAYGGGVQGGAAYAGRHPSLQPGRGSFAGYRAHAVGAEA